jgi:hypothetical protein
MLNWCYLFSGKIPQSLKLLKLSTDFNWLYIDSHQESVWIDVFEKLLNFLVEIYNFLSVRIWNFSLYH